MSRVVSKEDFPVGRVRQYLEPGPIVLVSSRHRGKNNIMAMGWHMVLGFSPSLVACLISSGNHSHRMVRDSGECVINLPTTRLTDQAIGIGNCSGASTDKFEQFKLTAQRAHVVKAPLIGECHACFECRIHDEALIERYDLFILEVVKAHVAPRPAHPKTLHYTGGGIFMTAGKVIDESAKFEPFMLRT